jgi:hypothetical protein
MMNLPTAGLTFLAQHRFRKLVAAPGLSEQMIVFTVILLKVFEKTRNYSLNLLKP